MQVSVENTGLLERQVRIEVPEERIASEVRSRLVSLSKSARIDGFRPGKIPLKVVERRFGGRVRQEVIFEVLKSSFQEAVTAEKLRPAGEPEIAPDQMESGRGLSYTATFEVYPEVNLTNASTLSVQKPVTEITDKDVDTMIETLRRQRQTWQDVTRAARKGDRLNIDYHGVVDGEAFEGGDGESVEIELGQGGLIKGFEDGLIGASSPDEVTLDLVFPDKYHSEELSGKAVRFVVKVNKVMESRLPDLDDGFFKEFGVEDGMSAFKEDVRKTMEREKAQSIWARTKANAMQALLDANPLELPEALVKHEQEQLLEDAKQRMVGHGSPAEQADSLGASEFEEEARRRVAMGLILLEVIEKNQLRADPTKVRKRIEAIAESYQDQAAVVKWYYDNKQRLIAVQNSVLEDEVVEWVLQNAQMQEIAVPFDALINPGQTENQH